MTCELDKIDKSQFNDKTLKNLGFSGFEEGWLPE